MNIMIYVILFKTQFLVDKRAKLNNIVRYETHMQEIAKIEYEQ